MCGSRTVVRAVSWNVHRCIGSDGHYSPQRVADVLKSLDADIIALQEIDSSLKTVNEQDQLSYIATALGMEPVMGPTLTRDYGAYGNAILSSREILKCEEYDLSYRKFEPRGALAVEISDMRLINTHLGLTYWERAFQIDRLLGEIVWREQKRTLLLGDFNEWLPLTGNMRRLERSFLRSPRLPTFPSRWPRFALDRILLSGPVDSLSHHVVRDSLARVSSDHLPIVAEFSFRAEKESDKKTGSA